jgi:hypothetical protein
VVPSRWERPIFFLIIGWSNLVACSTNARVRTARHSIESITVTGIIVWTFARIEKKIMFELRYGIADPTVISPEPNRNFTRNTQEIKNKITEMPQQVQLPK